MAYIAPELLLVGAAQNLVLETSLEIAGFKDGLHCKLRPHPEDIDEYQDANSW